MKLKENKIVKIITKRKIWIRQILVAAIASAFAWFLGDALVENGGLVAAIICSLSIRISLYKSVREGFGQIIGTVIGAGVALGTVFLFDFGIKNGCRFLGMACISDLILPIATSASGSSTYASKGFKSLKSLISISGLVRS